MLSKKAIDSIVGLVAMLSVTIFLIIGFIFDGWAYAWLIFLTIPITAIIVDMIFKKKKLIGQIPGLVALLATIAYMIMGFGFGLWHPGWIVFLAIPITGIIVNMLTEDSNENKSGQAPDDQEKRE